MKTIAKRGPKNSFVSYECGENYSLRLTKDAVVICDTSKDKTLVIPFNRWATLLSLLPEIEEHLQILVNGQFVNYKEHIGGGYFVSVSMGYACLDIRQFYMPLIGCVEKPTKTGLAIRLQAWNGFIAAVRKMQEENVQLANIHPCGDHANQEEVMQCRECNPFPAIVFGSRVQ